MAAPAPSTTTPPVPPRSTIVSVGGAPAKQAAEVPPAAARATAEAAIIGALVAFLAASRRASREWLQSQLASAPPDDIAQVIAEEDRRGEEFAEGSAKRMAGDLGAALAIPDPQLRQAKVSMLLEREKRYARQRSEAMAERAFAAVERVGLRRDSPAGAFWKLDPTVKEHTPGCLFMGERFWPWVVLDRVHPPRHTKCPCKLHSYQSALAAGWMTPADVPNVRDAVKMTAGVVMEAVAAETIVAELELRDALAEHGFATPAALALIPIGGA